MSDEAPRVTRIEGVAFAYDDRTLAPRAWTAAQSAWARELERTVPPGPILELCSGVGHIGLLAMTGHRRSLVMVDASEIACRFARHNVSSAGLADRVEIRSARLETALDPGERFPLVLADPPWVPTDEVAVFPEDPVSAIDGGEDGLDLARACLSIAARHLSEQGRCILQVGHLDQVDALGRWIGRESIGLQVTEVRSFERGVLALLGRE